MAETHDKLLDHEYDGIRELDNSLPRWWVWLLWLTIAWSFLYLGYYHVLKIGYLSADEYRREIDPDYIRPGDRGDTYFGILPQYRAPGYSPERDLADERRRSRDRSKLTLITRETDTATYIALTEPNRIAAGKEVFIRNCSSCHGANGQGDIGPNLTDKYWIHGPGMTNVVKSVKYGYPLKGMISWRGFISEGQILDVASYVLTLQGSNPANAKAPEGELAK